MNGMPAGLDRAIQRADYLRRSPFPLGGRGHHKEWLHFVVHSDEVELLVNLSLVDDTRANATPGQEFARTVVLTRDQEWDGAIELSEPDEVEVKGGDIHMRFGENLATYRDGTYQVRARMQSRPIAIDLQLEPCSFPALSNNIRLELDDRPINWMVIPRLEATGVATIGDRTYRLDRAPAYHDHNWGHFDWGKNFAWEWGFSLPPSVDCPWSLVFVRLADRGHTRALTQGLFLWNHEKHFRIFRGSDMVVSPTGFLRQTPFRLPGIMNVLSPGAASDVPQRLEARAEGDGDWAEFCFDADDVAQVCIPNDTDDAAVTVINEVGGNLALEGEVRGQQIEMKGRAMFEFVRGG